MRLWNFLRDQCVRSCGMPLSNQMTISGRIKMVTRVKNIVFTASRAANFQMKVCTLQEKIEKNVKIGVQMGMPEDMARQMGETILPHLNRWRKK